MKIYRTNVFETNSSSCHTISLGKDSKLFFAKDLISIIPDYQGNIKIKPIAVEFEWGFDKYNDAATKAIYMLYWNMDSVLIVQAIRDFLAQEK